MGALPESVYRHYLHSKDSHVSITPLDVAGARSFFNDVELKFVLVNVNDVVQEKLVDDPVLLSPQSNQRIISVLSR